MAKKKPSRRLVIVQVTSIAIAVLVAIVGFGMRLGGSSDAYALGAPPAGAPPSLGAPAAPAPTVSASAPASGGSASPAASSSAAAPGPAPSSSADAPPGDDPIDTAVAPHGGVPTHPSGTIYRSPFAKPDAGPPVKVKMGMLLNSVDDYDIKTGTFSADFFLSLTSEVPMPGIDLQFPNGKLDSKQVIADKPTFKLYRLTGQFKSPADLRKYPFDSQQLRILIEDDIRGIDQVRFVADPDRTKLARGFRAVGWQVSFVEARSLSQSYPDRFENDDLFYGRYELTLGLDRFASSAAFTVFVPAFVIVIISLMGMWVPPREMEVRSNSGAPMLAGAVLFHFALMQELPSTSYLTRADKLMMGVYVSLLLGMISTWIMFMVEEHHTDKVFRIARWSVPLATVAVMAAATFA